MFGFQKAPLWKPWDILNMVWWMRGLTDETQMFSLIHLSDFTCTTSELEGQSSCAAGQVALLAALCGLMCLQWAFLGPAREVKALLGVIMSSWGLLTSFGDWSRLYKTGTLHGSLVDVFVEGRSGCCLDVLLLPFAFLASLTLCRVVLMPRLEAKCFL